MAVPVPAANFTFSFDSLNSGVAMTGGSGATGSIQNYMNSVLGAAGSVAVTGVNGGAITSKYYDGDGHVVASGCQGTGSSSQANSSTSACGGTLGTDTFVKTNGSGSAAAAFTFSFTLPHIVIDSVSFDYEIFPDGSCAALNAAACGGPGTPNRPDMTFSTNLGQVFHDYGNTPVSPNNHSWVSSNEKTPQRLVLGYAYTAPAGVNSFTFTDWPATIAIDNFSLTYHDTPEPSAIILLGTLVFLVVARVRRKVSGAQA